MNVIALETAVNRVVDIPISACIPTEDNPRFFPKKWKEDPRMRELADSIRRHGVLEPVLCRPHPKMDGKYDLRAGERRLRACQLAELETVPAIVREMDDQTALEITVTENLQREDLHPLEEAAGLSSLLNSGWTLEQAANQLGKPVKWVARRAQLTMLTKEWLELAQDHEEGLGNWSASHWELIARLPPEMQTEYFQREQYFSEYVVDENRCWSLADLRHDLSGVMQLLKGVPWPLDDKVLIPDAGACEGCSSRSDVHPNLFDDVDFEKNGKKRTANDAHCLNQACFQRKQEAYLERKEKDARTQHGDDLLIVGQRHLLPSDSDLGQRCIDDYKVEPCRKSTKGAQPALNLTGSKAGKVSWVKPRNNGSGSSSPRPKGTPTPLADRRKQLEKARSKIIVEKLVEKLNVGEGVPIAAAIEQHDSRSLTLAYGVEERCNRYTEYDSHDPVKALKEHQQKQGNLEMDIILSTLAVIKDRLENGVKYAPEIMVKEVRELCPVFKIDYEEMRKQVEADKPEPKSWAKLNENGTPKKKAKAKEKPS
jgi:ParB/RepB/Spo0J family partition protein